MVGKSTSLSSVSTSDLTRTVRPDPYNNRSDSEYLIASYAYSILPWSFQLLIPGYRATR